MRRTLLRCLIALAVVLVWTAAPVRAESPPQAARAPVERLTASLLDTMKEAGSLGFAGRFEKLAAVLPEVFDFDFMTRPSAGRYRDRPEEDQRAAFVDKFARMSTATFAARFDGYAGQRFEVLEPRDGPRGSVLVPTRLVKPDGEAVSIDYLVRRVEHDWRVVDVYLGGKYSEVATKRAEYTSVLKNEGFDGLMKRL
jgi:phospholipid transport system substrate-binding protein